jgi:hypothetical protein
VFVLRVWQEFDSTEAAYQFYLDSAKLSRFSVRTKRANNEMKHWVCSSEGFVKPGKENEEPLTNKMSKRIRCPAHVKVKEDKKTQNLVLQPRSGSPQPQPSAISKDG